LPKVHCEFKDETVKFVTEEEYKITEAGGNLDILDIHGAGYTTGD